MAATEASDVTDGPVLSLINKRLRALRKKLNRITQMEEAVSQGKPLNKEQEDVLRSKPSVSAAFDELEKLRQPLSAAVSEEISLAIQLHQVEDKCLENDKAENAATEDSQTLVDRESAVVEDLLNLIYFGCMFDVKTQSDFTQMVLTRTHERGCCLTYDYVNDDATDPLDERDFDFIAMVGGRLISRPVDSSLSHKNALQKCIERAKLWLSNSDQPIESDTNVTYAWLREKLAKIMTSDYFTTTPQMKAPVEVAAAAAGNYGSYQVPVNVPVQVEGSVVQYQHEEEDTTNFQGNESYDNQSIPEEDLQKGEYEDEISAEVTAQTEFDKQQLEVEQNSNYVEGKEQQYVHRRPYQNQRGGRGGGTRRGYANGRGGRSGGRGGGPYQNGRNQYYDQPGNYYPRNYYNNRGRGGRVAGGNYNHHGSTVQTGNADP